MSRCPIARLKFCASLPREKGSDVVFIGDKKGQPLSNMALLMTLRRMERDDLTTHGFRSTFRDWAAETDCLPERDAGDGARAHCQRQDRGRLSARRHDGEAPPADAGLGGVLRKRQVCVSVRCHPDQGGELNGTSKPLVKLVDALERVRGTRPEDIPRSEDTIKPAPEDDAVWQWTLAHDSLVAVVEYLGEVGVNARLRAPLMNLIAALGDVSVGRQHPMFGFATIGPRTPLKKTVPRIEDGLAAAAVTLLQAYAGWTTKLALNQVADAMGYDPDKLRTLRKQLISSKIARKDGKRHASDAAVDAYNFWRMDYLRRRKEARVNASEENIYVREYVARMLGYAIDRTLKNG